MINLSFLIWAKDSIGEQQKLTKCQVLRGVKYLGLNVLSEANGGGLEPYNLDTPYQGPLTKQFTGLFCSAECSNHILNT